MVSRVTAVIGLWDQHTRKLQRIFPVLQPGEAAPAALPADAGRAGRHSGRPSAALLSITPVPPAPPAPIRPPHPPGAPVAALLQQREQPGSRERRPPAAAPGLPRGARHAHHVVGLRVAHHQATVAKPQVGYRR